MTGKALLQESIAFRSLPGVAGIDVLDAENSSRNWKWLHTAFGLALMTTWARACDGARHSQLQGEFTELSSAAR